MNFRSLLLLVAVSLIGELAAQNTSVVAYKDTAFEQGAVYFWSHLARAANGDAVVALDMSEGLDDRHVYVLRVDPAGVLQWMRRIDVESGQRWNIRDMAVTPDGSILINGTNQAAQHGFYLRLDPTGVPVAAKRYAWTGFTLTSTVQVLNDTLAVLFGNNKQNVMGPGWSVVIDAEGDLQTTAVSYLLNGFEFSVTQTHVLPEGRVFLYGRSDRYGNPSDVAVGTAVIDSTGAVVWAKRFSSPGLVLRTVGCVMLADGSARLVLRKDVSFQEQSTIVVALDNTGTVQWSKELHPVLNGWGLNAISVFPISDTTMAITGYHDGAHCSVMIIDTAATVLAHPMINHTFTTSEGYRDLNGDLVISGYTPVSSSFDIALIRAPVELDGCTAGGPSSTTNTIALTVDTVYTTGTQSLGVLDILSQFTSTPVTPVENVMCVATGVADHQEQEGPSLWPVPVNDVLHVRVEAIASNARYRIVDATGRVVQQGTLVPSDGGIADLHVAELLPGGYVLLLDEARGVRAERFMK